LILSSISGSENKIAAATAQITRTINPKRFLSTKKKKINPKKAIIPANQFLIVTILVFKGN
jgi:hypothetical protein